MTPDDWMARLDRLGFAREAYGLYEPDPPEAYCVARAGPIWSVYFNERGFRNDERLFDSEEAAMDELIMRLSRDSTTHLPRSTPPGR